MTPQTKYEHREHIKRLQSNKYEGCSIDQANKESSRFWFFSEGVEELISWGWRF